MRKDYDIVGSYNNQRITNIDGERTINMFEYIDPQGKKPKSLLPTSGLKNSNVKFSSSSGGFRAQFVFGANTYNVIGNNVYLVNSSLASSLIGTLTTSSGYVGIDANTFQIIFVDGHEGYIFDTTSSPGGLTFKQITDSSFPGNPIDVCYLDGFFVVANGGTNNFQLSSFNQGMVWGGSANNFTVPTSNTLTIGASTIGGPSGTVNYATGTTFVVSVSSGGTLPTGLVAGTIYYSILIDSTTIQVATSYINAIAGTFINVTAASGTGTFTITSLGQLQQASITSHPGTIVSCRTLHRRIFFFSQNFTEVWENSGLGSNLPFRRNNSFLMEYGCAALGSVIVGFDRMFFLSQDKDGLGAVMQVSGTESMPISNRALDFQLAQYASTTGQGVSDARGVLIKENGIIFYRLNFTSANHTFVYNVSMSNPQTPVWHEEEVLNGDRHPAQTHAYFNGVNYYGDYLSPIMYIVDNSVSTNNGESIRRARIGRPICPAEYNRIRIDRFQLDLLQGDISLIQINTTVEPYVFLSISRDGGQSYGNQIIAPMGKIGERSFRTVWRKLGTIPRGQAFIPYIQFWHSVPFVILGASWDFEIMPE